MGKQVQFYMSRADLESFLSYLACEPGIRVLPYWIKDLQTLDEPQVPTSSHDSHNMWLWNSNISPRPALRYIEQQRKWAVDEIHSEVVQFGRSREENGILQKGRLWADFSGLVKSSEIERRKSSEFEKWYLSLIKWIKREGVLKNGGVFALPGALQSRAKLS
jgi:hypothetical protein